MTNSQLIFLLAAMAHSPHRRRAIVHNPIGYSSPSPPTISHGSRRQSKIRSPSSERSLPPKESPSPGPGLFLPLNIHRPYRYHRIVQPPRRRKSYGSGSGSIFGSKSIRRLGYGVVAAVLVILGLVATGLYVYYFVNGQTSKKENIVFLSTIQPVESTEHVDVDANVTEMLELALATVANISIEITEISTPSTAILIPQTTQEIKTETVEATTVMLMEDSHNETIENANNLTTEASIEPTTKAEDRLIEEAFYYSEKVCVEEERNRECVAGTGVQAGICSQGGTCSTVQYHVNDDPMAGTFDPEAELRHLDLTNWPAPNGTLCRRETDDRLGVCSDGECVHVYNGTRRFQYMEGEWKDNCDQANPCWTTPNAIAIHNRSLCTMSPSDCNQDDQCSDGATVAVVWLEHRYCYVNPARAAAYCKGLPFRLWLCRFCHGRNFPASHGLELARAHAMDACLQKYSSIPSESSSGQCIVACHNITSNRTVSNVVMPNGSVCQISNGQDKIGYCYKGLCFPVGASLYKENLQTVEECIERKRIDSERWNG